MKVPSRGDYWSDSSSRIVKLALMCGLGRIGWSSSSIAFTDAGVKLRVRFRELLWTAAFTDAAELLRRGIGVPAVPAVATFEPKSVFEGFRDAVADGKAADAGEVLDVVVLKMLEAELNRGCENLRMSWWGPCGVDEAEAGFEPWIVKKRLSRSFRDLTSDAGSGMFCGCIGRG